jgi:hypothetical protein
MTLKTEDGCPTGLDPETWAALDEETKAEILSHIDDGFQDDYPELDENYEEEEEDEEKSYPSLPAKSTQSVFQTSSSASSASSTSSTSVATKSTGNSLTFGARVATLNGNGVSEGVSRPSYGRTPDTSQFQP